MSSPRHQWNSWQQYQSVHDNKIGQYLGHFILEDRVTRTPTAQNVVWDGCLLCADGLEISVDKRQEVRHRAGRAEVRTVDYSYHAYRRMDGGLVRNVLRYDNSHDRPGHPDRHHKHTYDDDGSDRLSHVGEADWPTLGQVIDELHDWWMANVREPAGSGE